MKSIVLLISAIVAFISGYSQSTSPVIIATSGDYFATSSYSVSWTLGETVIETYANTNIFLTQGFHQPILLSNDTVVNDQVYDFFNGFSPNGDNLNDWWRIPILDKYQTNTVNIFNRWGSEVWSTHNYDNQQNVFTGRNKHGNELLEGTYFYVIKYNQTEKHGWVFIKR